MEIESQPALHFERGRQGERPRGFVLHTNVGSFQSTLDWFADPESRVSAHYLIGLEGRAARLVDEEDTARHAGRVSNPTAELYDGSNPNLYTIGIEFEDGGDPDEVLRPDAQYEAGAALLASAARRWEIALDRRHVIGHRELTDLKSCPGNLDIERLLSLARALR